MKKSTYRLKKLGLMAALLLMGAGFIYSLSPSMKADRKPNFITKHPLGTKTTAKLQGPLQVQLESDSRFDSETPLTYRARLLSSEDLDQAQFKWVIPPDVELLSGSLTGAISPVKKGEEVVLEVTLLSHTLENRLLHIHVSGSKNAIRFTTADQFHTRDQEFVRKEKEALFKRSQADVKSRKLRQKIYQ